MSKFTLIADTTQINCFLECPQKWLNMYSKRLEPLEYKKSDAMDMGIYGHKLLDIYYRMRARGLSPDEAHQACLAYDPDQDTCTCSHGKEFHYTIPELGLDECKKCLELKKDAKCVKFTPVEFSLNKIDRNTVKARLRDYIFNYTKTQEDIVPLSEHHVELGFSEAIFEDSENLFILEGRIDLIGKLQGIDCFMDHKWQKKKNDLYPKSVQFKNYALISKTTMAVYNYVRTHNKTEKDSTLAREIVTFNSVELSYWKKELIQIFKRMKKTLLSKDEVDRNWSSCIGRFGNTCQYTPLCEEPDQFMVKRKEETLYKIQENVWRPW